MNKISKLSSFKDSHDAKVVLSNFSWLAVLQIASYVFPLITMPYLARVIGTTGFGKIAFAVAIIAWIQTVVDWGFNFTATRDVAKCRDDIEQVSRILSNVIWARLIISICCLIILSLLIVFIPSFRENYQVIYITFLIIPGYIICPEWFFQALEKMRIIALFNIFIKFVFTLGVFIFIKNENDFLLQPLLNSLGYFLCGGISLYLIFIKWDYKLYKPHFNEIFRITQKSFDVFINNLLPNLYNSFSIMLLGMWSGSTSTGILDAGNKFVNICIQFMSVISRAFFPYISRKIDKHSIYEKLSIGVSVVLSLFLFIFAPFIVNIFFTEEFQNAIIVMRIMAISNVFLTMSSVYGVGYLIIIHKERLLRNINAIASFIGFAISFPLVYYYDYIGAALTITISRGLIAFGEMYFAKRNR